MENLLRRLDVALAAADDSDIGAMWLQSYADCLAETGYGLPAEVCLYWNGQFQIGTEKDLGDDDQNLFIARLTFKMAGTTSLKDLVGERVMEIRNSILGQAKAVGR
ncbi:hypothetical protein EGT74_06365 [Chitinophaga lutea]|uniref:Uncharacterized protein n=1 Tax=Chitinophaga lutea TaxID=2488634 RepID=A0A3N4Q6J3_9BACT|nr:hypothetical protein [Chitinophaga lutea]RPE13151.1 hypothetical protein EGT74_06365 [Chitinophaga lutea]